MMELIDRQAALEVAMKYCPDDDGSCSKADHDIREMLDEIETLPTIEPKVPQAHWVNDTFCSNCNRFPVYQGMPISNQELAKYFSYCPHCGRKMDRGVDNADTR